MPRNSTGNYSLPIGAFIPGGLIKSSDLNTDFNDIATALTQSLATTGVSTMTGPINAAAGLVTTPSITFNGAPKTGFYLAGPNQIGITTNGVQAGTINADSSVNFAGNVTIGGVLSASAVPIGAVIDFAGSTAPAKWLLCYGQLVSTTTYAALFAVLGTTYGSGAGTFGIPDYRGRSIYGQDNMGGSAANRITVAGGNFDGTVLGGSGGGQNVTLLNSHLPSTIGTSTNVINGTGVANGQSNITAQAGATQAVSSIASAFVNLSINGLNNVGGGQLHSIMNPAIIANKIVYAGV